MNDKIELKFLRNIINSIYIDYSKTELIENAYYNEGNYDVDCISLMKISEKIKQNLHPSIELLLEFYSIIVPLFSKEKLDCNSIKRLERYMYRNDYIRTSHYIMKYMVFGKLSYAMGSIFFNLHYYKCHKTFLIIFSGFRKNILGKLKITSMQFKQWVEDIKCANEKYHQKNRIFTIDKIKETLASANPSIYEFLNVTKIYVYGSYAKGTENEYSDIDLLIETDNDYVDEMTLENFAHRVLEDLFESSVDVSIINRNRKKNGFEKNILDYAINVY